MTGPTLTAPFKHARQLRKGNTTLTYVPASEVIDRLNAVLGVGEWRFNCELQHADDTFIVVKGRLTACGGMYEQFGGQSINRNKAGEIIDLGDDYKGAASDALKKCAQMIGVGLYLALEHAPQSAQAPAGDSGGGSEADVPPSAPTAEPPSAEVFGEVDPGAGDPPPEVDAPSPASDRSSQEDGGSDPAVSPDDDPEEILRKNLIRDLIRRFNDLPLEVKPEAIALKRKTIGKDWFTAPPEAISLMSAKLTEWETVS